jgi:hypothetical protein
LTGKYLLPERKHGEYSPAWQSMSVVKCICMKSYHFQQFDRMD